MSEGQDQYNIIIHHTDEGLRSPGHFTAEYKDDNGNTQYKGFYPEGINPKREDKNGKIISGDDYERERVEKAQKSEKEYKYGRSDPIPFTKEEHFKFVQSLNRDEKYNVLTNHCGDKIAKAYVESKGDGKGTIGQFIPKEAYDKMDSTAGADIKSKYGYKGQNEFSKYSANQERNIEEQFNLPEGSVKSKGMEYKASEFGDHLEFKYEINNPDMGSHKGDYTRGSTLNTIINNFGGLPPFFEFNVPGYTKPLTPDPYASYKMPDFEYKSPYELYKSPFLKDLKETLGEGKDKIRLPDHGAKKDPYSAYLAQKELSECLNNRGGCGPIYESILRSVSGDYQSKASLVPPWAQSLRSKLGYAASHVSPLVLDLEGDGIDLLPYTKGVYFDIDNDGFKERVGWLSASDGQLARDVNRNGIIDDITELFGDDLISAFLKLSLLDSNKDGVIDESDESFGKLLVWKDKNLNGYSEPDELKTLKEHGIKSISLSTTKVVRVIEGNTITEISKFTYEDGREYEVADVHYHNDDMDSWYNTDRSIYEINKEELKSILHSFRKEVFSKINAAINNNNNQSHLLEGDWIKKIIEQETNIFIARYEKLKDGESDNLLEKINLQYSLNREEHEINCNKYIADFAEANEKNHIAKLELIGEELLKEINNKLKSANENINLKYNKNLKEAIEAESQRLLDYYRSNSGTQADYDSAIERFMKQAQEDVGKEAEKERLASREQYQEEYKQKAEEIGIKTAEKHKDNFTTDLLKKKHECMNAEGGMKRIYGDQFLKGKKLTDKDAELINIALKREANGVYVYHVNKIIESQNKTKEKIENDSYFNAWGWFANPIKNETHKENKVTNINFDKDEYYKKTGSKLEDAVHKSEMTGFKIDPDVLLLPKMRGYGKIPSLDIAMSKNPKLKIMVKELTELKVTKFSEVYQKMVDLMYEWAEVSDVEDGSRAVADGINIEARKVAFIEQLTGQEFRQMGVAKFVGQHASTAVQKAWDISLMRATKNLLVQGPFAKLFTKAEYNFSKDEVQLNSSIDEIFEIAEKLANDESNSGFWAVLGFKGDYNFWVHLGYILASCRSELNMSLDVLNKKLSDVSGYDIKVGDDIFQIIGDDRDNILKGTSGSDYIKGLKGDDKIYGEGGSDYIEGDEGNDEIYGGDGIDRIHGGSGNDKIYGGNDRDFLYGDEGDDEIYGEEGDDHIEGGSGADYMDGGTGINTLSYGSSPSGVIVNLATKELTGGHADGDRIVNFQNIGGSEYDDTLIGDDGDNHINGESGNDKIYGGKGDDHLFGGPGEDYLYGEEGDDYLTGFEGKDHIDGGEGIDTVSYHHPYSTEGVIVDLREGKGYLGYASGDTYKNIENVVGSKHRDKIYGNEENNLLNGMEGDDEIYGGKGDDIIIAITGDNKLYGEEGDDTIVVGTGSNYIDGGDGEDTLSYKLSPSKIKIDMNEGKGSGSLIHESIFVNIENIVGSKFDDKIIGNDKDNKLFGSDGDDKIYGGDGDDHIEGGNGADEIDGGEGIDTIMFTKSPEGVIVDLEEGVGKNGDAEGDSYQNIENVIGSKFADHIIGDKNNNVLIGGDGDDHIEGGAGNDILVGGKGADILDGGFGRDMVSYQSSEEMVEINLTTKQGKNGDAEGDTYIDINGAIGSKFNDKIIGSEYFDILDGKEGDDEIHGMGGDDYITGGAGNNKLYGEEGNDIFHLDEGNNEVDGGDGIDRVDYKNYKKAEYEELVRFYNLMQEGMLLPEKEGDKLPNIDFIQEGVVVNLKEGKATKGKELVDILVNIEDVTGSEFNDIITGDDKNNHIVGLNGNDKIYAGAGDDTIVAGNGENIIYAEEGNDLIIGSPGAEIIDGGEGNDSITYRHSTHGIKVDLKTGVCSGGFAEGDKLANIDNLEGSEFNDVIYDNNDDNLIVTNDGSDIVYLSDGNDVVFTGGNDDKVYINGKGNKFIAGGVNSDLFIFNKNFQTSGKLGTIILDFELYDFNERINLSAFTNINGLRDLKVDNIIITAKEMEIPSPMQYYFWDKDKEFNFSVIKISEEQTISLLNIEKSDLSDDNFIFWAGAKKESNNILQIDNSEAVHDDL